LASRRYNTSFEFLNASQKQRVNEDIRAQNLGFADFLSIPVDVEGLKRSNPKLVDESGRDYSSRISRLTRSARREEIKCREGVKMSDG
jgi:hypothetical protein